MTNTSTCTAEDLREVISTMSDDELQTLLVLCRLPKTTEIEVNFPDTRHSIESDYEDPGSGVIAVFGPAGNAWGYGEWIAQHVVLEKAGRYTHSSLGDRWTKTV